MDIREHERSLLAGNNIIRSIQENSLAFTGIVDGRIIACGGIVPLNNGNSEIWLIPSLWVSSVTLTFAREIRRWLDKIRHDFALNRMQTACMNDDLHNRWMAFLGFEKEGVMKKYHNGNDYCMWSKVVE